MDIRGSPTGPIDAKGAFTSEIDLAPTTKPGPLSTVAEAADRLPGRYLFRSYKDATKFRDFREAKVFPGEQITFWKRPFFFNTVRFAWCVTGAHDLAPITTHDLNRFERYGVPDAKFEARLPELFPALLEAARRLDLAHVSLMFQPEHNLVGVLTAAAREGGQTPSFETVRLSTDALALRGSVSEARLTELGARKIFDRTSLNLAVWLPLSEQAGGEPAIWPNSPPIPVPGVEHLGGAQPKAA